MDTSEQIIITETGSPEETFALGEKMGAHAKSGEIYTLDGDLGAGKTVFAQGFAQGLGIQEAVTSPTFTILQEYEGGRLPLYHFDVYRVSDPAEMEEIGFDDYLFGEGVCLIEWAELIGEVLPDEVIRIRIRRNDAKGFNERIIETEGKAGFEDEDPGD